MNKFYIIIIAIIGFKISSSTIDETNVYSHYINIIFSLRMSGTKHALLYASIVLLFAPYKALAGKRIKLKASEG